jgi:hypothetical protein
LNQEVKMEDRVWDEAIQMTTRTLLPEVPYLVALLLGIILAFVFIRRHPAMCVLAFAGFLILILDGTLGWFLSYYFPVKAAYAGGNAGRAYTTLRWVSGGVRAFAWILLLLAVFGWRSRKTELWYD